MPEAAIQAFDSSQQIVKQQGYAEGDPERPVGPLYRIAERIARNREVLGLHYPSDSVAGRVLAEQTCLLLKKCETMTTLFDLAAKEWGRTWT